MNTLLQKIEEQEQSGYEPRTILENVKNELRFGKHMNTKSNTLQERIEAAATELKEIHAKMFKGRLSPLYVDKWFRDYSEALLEDAAKEVEGSNFDRENCLISPLESHRIDDIEYGYKAALTDAAAKIRGNK